MSTAERLESSIERSVVDEYKKAGCVTYKLAARGRRSWPDRLVLGPGNLHFFSETKRPGQRLTRKQALKFVELLNLEKLVYVVTSREEACDVLRMAKRGKLQPDLLKAQLEPALGRELLREQLDRGGWLVLG